MDKPSLKSLKTRRRLVQVSDAALVQETLLAAAQSLPLMIQPIVNGLSLLTWVEQNLPRLQTHLHTHGGILFRGFALSGSQEFGEFMAAVSTTPMSYSYRSTPRTQVEGNVYTSTEYPADRTIPLHNEMAYARQWPLTLAFYCQQPALEQGETPIADSRRVLARIPEDIRQKFADLGVLYVRNYGGGLDLPWQEVFQTEDRQEVETFCRQADIEFEWWGTDQLRTRQVCDAIATHPHTHDTVWFNQAHLFHASNLGEAQQHLEHWPRNAYFGDGSEITKAVLAEIRAAFAQETILFPWQSGDVLLLDNMLTAHGRRPFTGPRRVLAGMADPYSSQDVQAAKEVS
ncbi:TauD/TfdA family dioxygenase [Acaryochloris sp. IP29b_bin.148]|uniref:TauD/TfdA family dioxygenase n=1 Tax=Acaryochloris sp. IP29b_bin.148 TaxID=2969218 RepID=UPI00262A03A2|nr:TauD/TfdA family dioxygenase [Acaryochloris sp. IP29b_bin.148]